MTDSMARPGGYRPVIGIPTDHNVDRQLTLPAAYAAVVAQAGGVPLLIPALAEPELTAHWLELVDGLLLAGGADVDPNHYGEDPLPRLGRITPERDLAELALARGALAAGLPILGICRGLQVLCVAAGGTLLQDIPSQVPGALKHRQQAPLWYGTHDVIIEAGTRLARFLGDGPLRVNSFHHQAVDLLPPGFRAVATAPDGIIEGMEKGDGPFALGVQWHPEAMIEGQPRFMALFSGFVDAAAAKAAGLEV